MSDLTDENEQAAQDAAAKNAHDAAAAASARMSMTPADERRPAASDDPDRRRAEEGAREIPSVIPQPVSPPIRSESKSPQAGTQVPTQGETWVETIKTVAYALLIALIIRTFFFQPFNIPSGSMENTLLIGDYLFVEKFAYGYSRYSFPFGLPPFPGRILGSQPHRGDVVVFKYPPDPSTDYIKRVIGLPGDRVQMINGELWLNGSSVPDVRVADYMETDDFGVQRHVRRYRETLPGGKSYYVLYREENGPGDNTQLYVIPRDHYFMMGDNRDNSADSRREVGNVGYVPAQNLVGKAELIFFSTNGDAQLWEFWKWPWAIRYNRLFTIID